MADVGDSREVREFIFDYASALSQAQWEGDDTFKPEAQRLSLMYSQAGILGNVSIIDFDQQKNAIGLDTNGDGTADQYEDRESFGSDDRINTNNAHLSPGDVISIDHEDGSRSEMTLNGTIATYDKGGQITDLKTMFSVPDEQNYVRPAYEDIKFDWHGGIVPFLQGPSATITDVMGNTKQGSLVGKDWPFFAITVGDTTRVYDSLAQLGAILGPGEKQMQFHYGLNRDVLNASSSAELYLGQLNEVIAYAPAPESVQPKPGDDHNVRTLVVTDRYLQIPSAVDSAMVPADDLTQPHGHLMYGVYITADNTVVPVS